MSGSVRTKNLLATAVAVALAGSGLAVSAPAQAGAAHASTVIAAKAVASSTALTVSPRTVGYGAPVTAIARVTTASGSPEGDVTFVIQGAALKVPVEDGFATVEIKRASVGVTTVSATFTPKDGVTYEGSSAPATSFTVDKSATVTRVRVMGDLVGDGVSTTVEVVGLNGTVATGKVRLVLRKVGDEEFRKVMQGRLGRNSRGFSLGRLDGRYRMVVKYLGDGNHERSKAVKRFRVRP